MSIADTPREVILSIEEDFVAIKNGLANLLLIREAAQSGNDHSEEDIARGLQSAIEPMSAALNRIGEKLDLR